jgi:hypothetical protein
MGSVVGFNNSVTLNSSASIAVNQEELTGSDCKHIELDSTYTLMAYADSNADIKVRLGVKDSITCITWANSSTTLAGTYTLEDFVKLDSTHGLLLMRDTGANMFASVVTFSAPSTITISAAVDSTFALKTASTGSCRACLINTNKVVIIYKSNADDKPYTVICTISGTTPSFGTSVKPNDAACLYEHSLSICKLTTTTFFATYNDNAVGKTYAQIMSFDGNTTITTNTQVELTSGLITATQQLKFVSCAMLDSTHVIIACGLTSGSDHGHCVVAVISGTTISSFGAAIEFHGVDLRGTSVLSLSASKFLIVYVDNSNTSIKGNCGLVSGSTITIAGSGTSNYNNSSGRAIPSSNSLVGSINYIDSTNVSFAIYDIGVTNRQIYYGIINTYNINSCRFLAMKQLLYTVETGKEVSISLITNSGNIEGRSLSFYLDDNIYPFANNLFIMSSANYTTTDFAFGYLKLANCPIILTSGQKLYIATNDVVSSSHIECTIFGLEETL